MMNNRLGSLLGALEKVGHPPTDLGVALAAAPPAGTLPPPRVTWTLLGLVHYRERKRWAWEVLCERLCAEMKEQARGSLVSITDVLNSVRRGVVPGLPDWEYQLDGNNSSLTHRGTGERIHVDALNGPELLPDWAFAAHFLTHRSPGPAEQRLARLFPRRGGLVYTLGILRRAGLLHRVDETDGVLCKALDPYVEPIGALLEAWPEPESRAWLASLIGDWPAAHETARGLGRPDLVALAAPRAEECRRRWLGRVRRRAERRGLSEDTLLALADGGAEDLGRYLEAALADPDTLGTAIGAFQDDPSWCPRVFDQLLAGPQPPGAEYFNNEVCARYLGRHGYRVDEVIAHLLADEHPRFDVLVELALGHAPELLTRLLPRAVRASDHLYRLTGAAVLALLDTGWSRHVLAGVLDASASQDKTFECRAALRESGDPEAGRAADRWEARHPERKPATPVDDRFLYTFSGGVARALRERMSELSDAVRQARGRLPVSGECGEGG